MIRSFARQFSSTARRADIARFTAVGRIGADLAVQRSKSSEREYLRYPLAVQNPKEGTSWFYLSVFDPNAITFMTTHLAKGSTVYVEADATISSYNTDAGETRQSLNLVQQTISPVIWKPRKEYSQESEEGAAL